MEPGLNDSTNWSVTVGKRGVIFEGVTHPPELPFSHLIHLPGSSVWLLCSAGSLRAQGSLSENGAVLLTLRWRGRVLQETCPTETEARTAFCNQEAELALSLGSSPKGTWSLVATKSANSLLRNPFPVTRDISPACRGWHGNSAECESGLETTTTSCPFPELASRFAFGKTKAWWVSSTDQGEKGFDP